MISYDRESLSEMLDMDRELVKSGFSIGDLEGMSFGDYFVHYTMIVNKK